MIRAYSHIDEAWARLRMFLGSSFREDLTDHGASCAYSEQQARIHGNSFYADSNAYLYELTHFHFSGHKDSFFGVLLSYARAFGMTALADIGCGVGLDAQALIQLGFDVQLFDFESPSADYAEWRLLRDVGITIDVQPLTAIGPGSGRMAYLVDVLEHVTDPKKFVRDVAAAYDNICINLFPHDAAPHVAIDLHYPTNHWELLPLIDETHLLIQAAPSSGTVTLLWRRRHARYCSA